MPKSPLLTLDFYLAHLQDAARIAFIFVAAYIATMIARRAIRSLGKYSVRMMVKSGGHSEQDIEKRVETISGVARKSAIFMIWAIAFMMIMARFGFEIGPLVASLGLVGVAVGFGAQNVVKDVLAGLFLLIENQIRVNDVATINGTSGVIEEINLRTTVLRAETGAVHIFTNGSIQSLANLTRDYSYFVFELTLDYGADTDRAVELLREIAATVAAEESFKTAVLAPLDVYGVDRLGQQGVVIKGRIKTLPGQQWALGREINRRVKMQFGAPGIEIPFPIQTVRVVGEKLSAVSDQRSASDETEKLSAVSDQLSASGPETKS